jgi:hypothetical protein
MNFIMKRLSQGENNLITKKKKILSDIFVNVYTMNFS